MSSPLSDFWTEPLAPGSSDPAPSPLRILHLEDNALDITLVREALRQEGVDCLSIPVATQEEFRTALIRKDFDLILADRSLPDFDGLSALELAREHCPEVPFILLSGTVSEEGAVFAQGVTDFVPKERHARLAASIQRAIRDLEQRRRRRRAEEQRDRFFELSTDLLALIDFEGRFVRTNAAWTLTLGWRPEQLTGTRVGEHIHADDRSGAREILERLAISGGSGDFTARHRAHDGSWRWLHWKATADSCQRLIYATARDITEQRLAQENIRQREEYFRALIENATDIITVLDTQATILYESPAIERVLGYRPDELIGVNCLSLVHPEDRDRVAAQFQAVCAAPGSVASSELRFRHKDGSWRFLEAAARNLDRTPGVTGVVVNSRDVTERKRAEEEIQRLAAFPRQNPHAVFEFDPQGVLTYFNDAAAHIAGVLGHNHPSRILPPAVEDIVRQCLACGQSRLHLETTHADRILSWSFYPVAATGTVHGYAEDITERRRIEQRIREQAAWLDKAHDAILVATLDRRIIYWNHAAERLYGWPAAEALGRNALELIQCVEAVQLDEAQSAVTATGEWNGELKQRTRAGGEIVVRSSWTLVRDAAGQPQSVLVISTDITEQQRLHAQFLRAQRLESIGTLASGIAHDLNNVLAPIMMSVNLLQEGTSDVKSAKLLETLRLSAERGADLVKQILSFTRGQEGCRGLVNLKHLVADLTKILRETFPRAVQIKTSCARNLHTVQADATQIHQVLMNLAVNARDAMPRGGILTIRVENARLDDHQARQHLDARPGDYVVLTVEDTGTGIPPQLLNKVFDPFVTTKAPGKGTGLGLSTTLSIVKGHGGFIHTESEVGKGTRFRVYLPAAAAEAPPGLSAPIGSPPRGRGETILVVDDERAFLEIAQAILTQNGYKVLTASDGAEALALFAQHKPAVQLVITDMMMPFVDGSATIRALHHMQPDLMIIAASGLAENEAVTQTIENTRFLPKPFAASTLLMLVHDCLRSTRSPA
ncbi:MAG TPA: PAS domain S-box protein [Methylomirabilota bacterium]|nr:PAS domain S-box protein [Methylomirabilota bacterium]